MTTKKNNHKFRNDSTQINHGGLFTGKDKFEYEFEEPYRPYGNSDTSNTALYREISDDTRYKRKPSQDSDPYQQKVNIDKTISSYLTVLVMDPDPWIISHSLKSCHDNKAKPRLEVALNY